MKTLGFGAEVFDFDNDGYPDIYVTNGHVIDNAKLFDPQLSYRQADLLYRNLGGGRFRDVSAESGPAFRIQHVGRGLAVADLRQRRRPGRGGERVRREPAAAAR